MQLNANARNIMLSEALLIEGEVAIDVEADREITYELIKGFPVRAFIEALTVNLNPEYSLEADQVMSFRFSDTYSIPSTLGFLAMFRSG